MYLFANKWKEIARKKEIFFHMRKRVSQKPYVTVLNLNVNYPALVGDTVVYFLPLKHIIS